MIIWGTKSRKADGGIVGDWCQTCRAATYFRLTHFYSVGHLYYIPLGQGTFVGATRRCTKCGREETCYVQMYARALTDQEATGRGMDEIMRLTNPQLDEKLRKQHVFQQEMSLRTNRTEGDFLYDVGNDIKAQEADQRMLAALNALSAFDIRRKDVADYLEQLNKWDYLSAPEREVLLREVEAFTKQDAALTAVVHFIKSLPSPTPDWIVFVGLLGVIVIPIVGFSTVPFLQSWLWGTLFVIATLVLVIVYYFKMTAMQLRVWVNKILIPRSSEARIDLPLFLSVLAGVDTKARGMDQRICDMANNLKTIAGELSQRGLLTLDKKAGPVS